MPGRTTRKAPNEQELTETIVDLLVRDQSPAGFAIRKALIRVRSEGWFAFDALFSKKSKEWVLVREDPRYSITVEQVKRTIAPAGLIEHWRKKGNAAAIALCCNIPAKNRPRILAAVADSLKLANREKKVASALKAINDHLAKLEKRTGNRNNFQPKINFLTDVKKALEKYVETGEKQSCPQPSEDALQRIYQNRFSRFIAQISDLLSKTWGQSETSKIFNKVQTTAARSAIVFGAPSPSPDAAASPVPPPRSSSGNGDGRVDSKDNYCT